MYSLLKRMEIYLVFEEFEPGKHDQVAKFEENREDSE
jgi:hypothetical protein